MKFKSIFGAMASLAALVGCTPDENEQGAGGLFITVNNKTSVTFEVPVEGGFATYEVNAGEDWFSEISFPEGAQEWVSVNPPTGKAGKTTVTVTALPNTGFNREQDIKFSIGMKSAFVSVTQAGDKGDEAATVIYYNNFDKEPSAKEGSYWPKPGESDVWKNETGSGVANIDYSFSNVDVRSNGNDAQHYREPYASEASFVNNIFFGSKEPRYFIVKNIALGGAANLALSWGTEKYSQDNGSTFTNSEYQLYLSNDGGSKWVEIQYEYLGTEDGKWNLAKAEFSVPTGTETLSVAMVVTVASSYRMDDLKLVSTETATTTVDFTAAVEKDFSSTGGGSTEPSTPVEVAKSIETGDYWVMNAEKTTVVYPIDSDEFGYWKVVDAQDGKSTAENAFTFTWVDGKGYTIKDSKGRYHFMTTYNSFSLATSEQSDGSHYWAVSANQDGTYNIVNTVSGKTVQFSSYGNYAPYTEVTGALPTLVAANDPVEGGDQGGETPEPEQPSELTEVTIAEFLAKEDSETVWYKITGEITDIANSTYGNLTITQDGSSVYVYGLTATQVSSNDKSFGSLGLKVGDVVTIASVKTTYNGTVQGGGSKTPAYYISHVAGEDGGEDGDDDPVVTPPVAGSGYVKVTSEPADWSGKYLVVGEDGGKSYAFNGEDAVNGCVEVTVSSGTIAADASLDACVVEIAAVSGGYSLKVSKGYMSGTNDANKLNFGTTAVANTLTFEADGVKIESNTSVFRFNSTSNQMRFRYYKASTYTSQKPVQLYKLAE